MLTTIDLPATVTDLASGVFYGCSGLKSIALPEGITTLSRHLFDGCSSLTALTVPNSVTTIEDACFKFCSSLTRLTLGTGVLTIGEQVVGNCDALTTIVSLNTTPPALPASGLFAGNAAPYYSVALRVPADALDAYKRAAWWSMFQTILPLDDDATGIAPVEPHTATGGHPLYDLGGRRVAMPRRASVTVGHGGRKMLRR